MNWKGLGIGALLLTGMQIPWLGIAGNFDLERVEPEKHAELTWVGHRNPDCDSLAAAVACAAFYGGTVRVEGAIGREAKFLLESCNLALPECVEKPLSGEVALVDHNQAAQSLDGLTPGQVVCVIDHHGWGADSLLPSYPIAVDVRNWSATSAIVADRILRSGEDKLTPDMAKLLLGGILSDTGNLDDDLSPREEEIVTKLVKISGVEDLQAWGQQMLEIKSDYSMLSASEVLTGDYKEYQLGNFRVGFGLAETLFPEPLLLRREELLEQMKVLKKERQLDLLFFAVKDIKAKKQLFLLAELDSEELNYAKMAYGKYEKTARPGFLVLKKTSRKNFLIPCLQAVLEQAGAND